MIDQEVAELKLFGFTLKKKRPGSGHYKTPPEETRYYDEEDIARLKKQYADDFKKAFDSQKNKRKAEKKKASFY